MNLEYSHEQIELARLFGEMPLDVMIVDVGCGRGRNLDLLKQLGFSNLIGVEVNPELLEIAKSKGHIALSPDAFNEKHRDACVDVVMLSHIIEHFEHRDLVDFLSGYLDSLKPGGAMVIATPLMSDCFYNDFDHVRPYLPMGLSMIFAPTTQQVQFQADHVMTLEDIRFFRAPFRLQWCRIFYVADAPKWPLWVNRIFRLIFLLSRGLLGYRSGWIGRYRYVGRRNRQAKNRL